MAIKVPQGKTSADFRTLSANTTEYLKQAKHFGELPSEHLQHVDSVFANPYRSAGSAPLAVHNAAIDRGQRNTGVTHTVIGPTGPNSQPNAHVSKRIIQPHGIAPPKMTAKASEKFASRNPLNVGPGGLVQRGVNVNARRSGTHTQGKPGFFPKPST
jgi:hypothetical protein